jgi:hypothetical protein
VDPRSTAAAVEAKNMPQAYFLYAPTILKEIIVYQYQKRFRLEAFLFLLYALVRGRFLLCLQT